MPDAVLTLAQRLVEIVAHASRIVAFAKARPELDDDETQQLSYSCAELALLALCTADDEPLLRAEQNPLLRTEIASRLREIALHCLDVQVWEQDAIIRGHIEAVEAACNWISANVALPELMPTPDQADQADTQPPPCDAEPEEPPGIPESHEQLGPVTALSTIQEEREEDRILRLRAEIRALRELLTSLILERDQLLTTEKRDLESAYMLALGRLEAEVYLAEYDMRIRQRRLELMQAMRNRRKQIEAAKVDEQLRAAQEEFQRILEETIRKAAEAEAQRREQEQKQAEKARRKAKKKAAARKQEQQADGEAEEQSGQEAASKDDPKLTDGSGENASTEEEEDEDRKLRRLYHKIVKAMHPDLHPNQDEATKNLFKKAIIAYKEGKLRVLEEIAAMLDGQTPEPGVELLEALKKEREHLFELIFGLRAELRAIRNQFPFNKKALLNDPERLAELQERLRKKKELAQQKAAYYQKRIDEMEAEDGRADPA